METKLGKLTLPPDDINELTGKEVFRYLTRMERLLRNWQDGFNSKIHMSVNEENKEWMMELVKDTCDELHKFRFVFTNE
jgi:hypothetical protein